MMNSPYRWLKCFLIVQLVVFSSVLLADDDYVVYSPHVVKGQTELESRAYAVSDSRPGFAPSNGYLVSLGHTFTDYWKSEVYFAEYQHLPGSGNALYGHEWENTFQLSERGEYAVDWGFLAAYSQHILPGVADSLELGPLIEKDLGRLQQRLNLLVEKDVFANATLRYAPRAGYALSYRVTNQFQPGFEAYYRPIDHAHQIGPMLQGELFLPHGKEIEYAFGVLRGLNNGAPQNVIIARMSYEFF
ncbi:MAG: hypothetical protein B7Z60_05880 [Ferrovum sp. 37-45-19]|uniref:hypothetical protein n=1 Tax=Ferrovum sp. JA12 TaxID=1356299 RepID=UPI0007027FF6|nr:hypothetical protein [Ferrovum sp. JA12]OYV79513.1 MAG: hypothetical protein B7Z65_06035 [Ferrovum sp. 21-44-67]OYV94256.1 MAG: hypothetical protein B7Z60_05880 [Ferrovum sp. 37-45-19]OZB31713.1 MAG: hypothetical protein B7X47_08640 [Ferrovum sp. 34-44-207]HQT81729.1 hypothetical protein [Ferrovaceae bacterium]KRH78321.1 hypothetical protein FERRO_13040 [Ferrovum sp. JA12]